MDDSDPAWPPALARNSRLSTPSARSPLTTQAQSPARLTTSSARPLRIDPRSRSLSVCLSVPSTPARVSPTILASLPCDASPTVPRLHDHLGPRPDDPTWADPTRPAPRALFAHQTGRGRTRPHWAGPDPAWFAQSPRHMCSRSLSCLLHLRIHGPSLSSSLACGARKAS